MSDNELRVLKVRSAPRGSKKGWLTVTGQVPPEVGHDFLRMVDDSGKAQTDVVHEAVAEWMEKRRAA